MATDNDEKRSEEDETQSSEVEPEGEELSADGFAREPEDVPPEIKAQFLMNVVAYEQAPWTTHSQQLEEAGIKFPAATAMNDEQLKAKLWEVIEELARRRVFISQTDHLNDRELYELLWSDTLHEPAKDMVLGPGSAWFIDILGSGSEEDTELYLKYYADEDYRRQWAERWPGDSMPEHVDPPFDRDRNLPKADDMMPVSNDDVVM